jgi:hypothetical protein
MLLLPLTRLFWCIIKVRTEVLLKGGVTDLVKADAVPDCGLTHFDEAGLKATLKERFPDQGATIETMAFGSIGKLGQSLVDDAVFIKQHPLVRKEVVVKGFLFDVESGLLEEVV